MRGDDLEVDGAVGIGENEQLVAAVGDRILHALLARGEPAGAANRDRRIDSAAARRFVIATGDHENRPLELHEYG